MLKKILIGLVVILVLFLGFVALQPSDFRVERGITINAPADVVFGQVNDFHNWQAWSPWAKLDPNMKTTLEGPTGAPGAIYSWEGNDEVGSGRMTLIASQPNSLIRIKLDFFKPFESTSTTEFTFKAEGEQTSVLWSMSGKNNFLSRLFCVFMNMDKMVGGDFEKGLAQMKAVAEAKK